MTHTHPLTPHQSPFLPIPPLCNNQTRTPPNTRPVQVVSILSTRTIHSRIYTRRAQDKDLSVHTLLEGLGTETTLCQTATGVQLTYLTLTGIRMETNHPRGRLLPRRFMRAVTNQPPGNRGVRRNT